MELGSGSFPDEIRALKAHHGAMSAIEMQTQLQDLQTERALASIEGLSGDSAYMAELDQEIAVVRSAYVVAAVTEIATLRAQLSGPQVG